MDGSIVMMPEGEVVSYLMQDFTPASRQTAELVKVVYPDGRVVFGYPVRPLTKGGPGSGFHGHAGRPGQVGGSTAEGGTPSVATEGAAAPSAGAASTTSIDRWTEGDKLVFDRVGHEKEFLARQDADDQDYKKLGERIGEQNYTPEEYGGIHDYVITGSDELNHALRHDQPLDRFSFYGEKRLSAFIEKNPLPEKVIGLRGIEDVQKLFGTEDITKLKGRSFVDKGFTSVSTSPAVAASFIKANGALVEMDIPKGTPAAYVGKWAVVAEDELILGRNNIYEVTEVIPKGVSVGTGTFGEARLYDRIRVRVKGRQAAPAPQAAFKAEHLVTEGPHSRFVWKPGDIVLLPEVGKGGAGSGFHGHAGRPGMVGGSAAGAGAGGMIGEKPVEQDRGPTPVSAADFHNAFQHALAGVRGGYLTPYSEAEYRQMKTFLAADGKVGAALKDHGDGRVEIVSIFNVGGPKGYAQKTLIPALIKAGGNYLECFDGVLPKIYGKLGFVESGRYPWDDSLAPSSWDYASRGRPDFLTMKLKKTQKGEVAKAAPVADDYARHQADEDLLRDDFTQEEWDALHKAEQ